MVNQQSRSTPLVGTLVFRDLAGFGGCARWMGAEHSDDADGIVVVAWTGGSVVLDAAAASGLRSSSSPHFRFKVPSICTRGTWRDRTSFCSFAARFPPGLRQLITVPYACSRAWLLGACGWTLKA
jgi:hypothetical protein